VVKKEVGLLDFIVGTMGGTAWSSRYVFLHAPHAPRQAGGTPQLH